jgi:hypothetical protein
MRIANLESDLSPAAVLTATVSLTGILQFVFFRRYVNELHGGDGLGSPGCRPTTLRTANRWRGDGNWRPDYSKGNGKAAFEFT